MRLTFLGAAGEVTGSCHLAESGEARFLLDCGMFQGGHAADAKNRRFAFEPGDIDFVVLSHAHIDHSGLLPRLVVGGFKGRVFATPASCDLLSVMLPDAGYLQEKEAEREGDAPLYTQQDAEAALERLVPVEYGKEFAPHAGVRCVLRDAGHILGSAIVEVIADGRRLVFSGDLGSRGMPVVHDPAAVREADVLLVESTYGDRRHKSMVQTLDELAYALNDTLRSRRGNVVIPSFAVGRTQDLLVLIARLREEGRVPAHRLFVDSPMAVAATRITRKYATLPDIDWLRFVADLDESRRLAATRSGAVILSASGMCEGGRIRRHLHENLPRPECSIVFVGFQAAGTLGRRLVDGAESVRIYGDEIPVRARVFTINGLSAHADQEGLLAWLSNFPRPPRQTWVVHGEPLASQSLCTAVRERLGWRAEVPAPGHTTQL